MTRGVQFKRRMQRLLIHLILIIFSIIMIVPFVWMTLTAFKTVTEATSVSPFVIFPSQWRTDAFTTVWNNMNFLVLYKNTLLLIFFRVVCACLTATLAGYAFARLKFKGRDFMFSLILFQMMIPSQIFIIPQFLMISKMGMTNTMFALVFPGIVTGSVLSCSSRLTWDSLEISRRQRDLTDVTFQRHSCLLWLRLQDHLWLPSEYSQQCSHSRI